MEAFDSSFNLLSTAKIMGTGFLIVILSTIIPIAYIFEINPRILLQAAKIE